MGVALHVTVSIASRKLTAASLAWASISLVRGLYLLRGEGGRTCSSRPFFDIYTRTVHRRDNSMDRVSSTARGHYACTIVQFPFPFLFSFPFPSRFPLPAFQFPALTDRFDMSL